MSDQSYGHRPGAVTPDQKRLATLQARAALAGVVLHAIEGDHGRPLYVLTRWHLTREMRTLAEVEVWLDKVTGGRE